MSTRLEILRQSSNPEDFDALVGMMIADDIMAELAKPERYERVFPEEWE